MFTLRVKHHFDSAHYLPDYQGKCAEVHGHTWYVEVCYEYDVLNAIGIAVDFKFVKNELGKIVDELDHNLINHIIERPTAENIARWIYGRLKTPQLKRVTVWESPTCSVSFEEESAGK